MTLQEAITRVENYMNCIEEDGPVEFDTSLSLLIEAGKGIQEIRDNYPEIPIAPLPSETKE